MQADTVAHSLDLRCFAEQVAQPAGGLFLLGDERHIPHVIGCGCAVAVFHGETGAVERQTNAAPSAIHLIGQHQRLGCFVVLHGSLRLVFRRLPGRLRLLDHGGGPLLGHAQGNHHAPQEFVFEGRVIGARLPAGGGFVAGGIHLLHATLADENIRSTTGILFQTGAVPVELTGGIQRIQRPPQNLSNRIQRDVGAILGPVGFHHADLAILHRQHKATVFPEGLDGLPQFDGRTLHHQPALVAIAPDLYVADRAERRCRALAGRCFFTGIVCGTGAAWYRITPVTAQPHQVGRNFQRIAAPRRTVINTPARLCE